MAILTGPLLSVDARGKLGNALVFIGWKGRKTVRQWLKPKNPMSADQGDVRLILGGTGRAGHAIAKTSDYAAMLETLSLIPPDQSKQSYIVKSIINSIMSDATAFEAEYTAYDAHTAQSDFDDAAVTLGLLSFDVAYKGTAHSYPGGLMVYVLADIAIRLGFTGAPYTTALGSWTSTQIDLLVAALAPA